MGTIEGTLYIRWENGTQASTTPRYKLMLSRYKNPWEGVHITSREEGLYNLLVNYRSGDMWSPKGGAQDLGHDLRIADHPEVDAEM
jgi:hypothetical protein